VTGISGAIVYSGLRLLAWAALRLALASRWTGKAAQCWLLLASGQQRPVLASSAGDCLKMRYLSQARMELYKASLWSGSFSYVGKFPGDSSSWVIKKQDNDTDHKTTIKNDDFPHAIIKLIEQ